MGYAGTVRAMTRAEVDRGVLVSKLVYEGLEPREIAKEMRLSTYVVKECLEDPVTQRMVEECYGKKLEIVSRIPIANMATRLKRYEELYESGSENEDPALMLKALGAAREESKGVGGDEAGSGVRVRIMDYEPGQGGQAQRAVEVQVGGNGA